MKITATLTAALFFSLTGCVTTSTISAGPENISVKGLNASEATPVADTHCKKFGKTANFTGSAPEGRTAYSTYFFTCL